MKKNYLLLLIVLSFLVACTDDSGNEQKTVASFILKSTQFNVGDDIKITNTSKSDSEIVSYLYDFGNETSSTEKEPTIYYSKPGEYIIKLTIKDSNGNTQTSSAKVIVNLDDSYFIDTGGSIDTESIPLEIGIKDGKIFITDIHKNINSKYYFRHVTYSVESYLISYYQFLEKEYNSGRASTTFLDNGNKIINVTQTADSYIWGYNEINVAKNGYNFTEQMHGQKVFYGSLPDKDQYFFYGASGNYPSIEIRNSSGEFNGINQYSVIENGFIGDLIKNGNTYIAFGGKFDRSSDNTSDFINYQPMMLLFDENLILTGQKTFQFSTLSEKPKKWNDLNGNFTIRKLSNSNFALYSHDNLIIASSTGEMLKTIKVFNSNINTNSLITVEDGFIISTYKQLEKYDNNGNILKTIASKGIQTPGFVKKGDLIYFASAYNSSYNNLPTIRTFFGSIDSNLNYKRHQN